MNSTHSLILGLVLSLILSFFQFGKPIRFPFQIFTTWLHECFHALAATLLGGSAVRITLASDGSGLTQYKISQSRMRQALVTSSGYLGASAGGCLLLLVTLQSFTPHPQLSPEQILLGLSTLIALSLLFWIRNVFGFISVCALGAILVAILHSPLKSHSQTLLLFIAIQTALNALFDIRVLFALGGKKASTSDAHQMQKLCYLPYWFWALSWMILSFAMIYATLMHAQIIPAVMQLPFHF